MHNNFQKTIAAQHFFSIIFQYYSKKNNESLFVASRKNDGKVDSGS